MTVDSASDFAVIGRPLPRIDGLAKVTGQAKYAADLALPGMLWGKVLRSPLPHARILHVDTSRAERLSGVRGVITGKDAVGAEKYGFTPGTRDKLPFETDKVRYVGDEVAAVAALDADIAEEAVALIRVEYEPLKPVFDPAEALRPDAPLIHEHLTSNVSAESHQTWGDVAKGFAESAAIREAQVTTQVTVHGFIEPHAALAEWDHNGKATLWGSKQSPYIAYRLLTRGLGMPLSKLRMVAPYVGGAFGGKQEPFGTDFAALLLSRKTGKPVKVVYDQEEVFISGTRRHAMRYTIKAGVSREGKIKAVELTCLADGGAYSSFGAISIFVPGALLTFPLHMESLKYDGHRVYTNKPYAGALIGHCIPQTRLAFEYMVDQLAEAIGMDALELRMRNAVRAGDTTVNGRKMTTCRFTDSLSAVAQEIGWQEKRGKQLRDGSKVRGVGIGCTPGMVGGKLFMHDASSAMLKVQEDGIVSLLGGFTDSGQGADTVMAMIVAETLGIDLAEVNVTHVDSDFTPMDPGSFGSRTTFCSGQAVLAAANDLKRQLLDFAAAKLEVSPDELVLRDHRIAVKDAPEASMPLLQVMRGIFYGQGKPLLAVGTANPGVDVINLVSGTGAHSASYSTGAQAAEVEVDTETGRVTVLKMAIAHDSGRAINPLLVDGQQHGPSVSGAAQVLAEDLPMDKGVCLATNFLDYGMPSALDASRQVTTFHMDAADPYGPYGAKDASEAAQVGALPAVANAIADAIGVRILELPITPERVLAALAQAKAGQE